MLATWVRNFRLFPPPRATAWRRQLAARGVAPLALRVLANHPTLADAWTRCPRVDWALEIALCARVEPALVRRGLLEVVDEASAWRTAPASMLDRLTAGAEALGAPADLERALALGPTLCELVERDPELQAAMRELRRAERWKLRARTQAAADAYDARHRETHRALAARFRRAVTADALALALGERPSHPYR